jgi:ribose transport system permease protein
LVNLRLRAFITTLITRIIYRSAYDLLLFDYSNKIAAAFPDIPSWNFLGGGGVVGVPSVVLVYIVVAVFGHVFLTRLRPGWHVTAIGGSRRSAYNSGIPVRRTIALCYTASGVLTAIGALFFAARLGTVGGDVGVGLEVTVLTATVLGGISLGGGKGSVAKALVGTLIVLFVINGLTTLSVSGGVNRMVLAGVLLVAATIDIRWLKNRNRIISKVYVSPTFHGLAAAASTEPGSGPFAQNDKLRDVTLIGLGASRRRKTSFSIATTILCRFAPRRHHPLPGALLPADGGIRPYRRSAARHGVRSRRQSLCLHRRHGPLPHHAGAKGGEGHG